MRFFKLFKGLVNVSRIKKTYPYLIIIPFFLILSSEEAYSINDNICNLSCLFINSTIAISTSFIHLLWTLGGTLGVIITIILFFIHKVKKINRELEVRDKQILDIKIDLQRAKEELGNQKKLTGKESFKSDNFYELLLQRASEGISFCDKQWNLIFANDAYYSLIGQNRDSYNSSNENNLIHPDNKDYKSERDRALNNIGFFDSELRLKHVKGYYVNLASNSVVVRNDNDEVLGTLTISRDIKKLKQVHADLIKANIDAEESNRLKSSFLANISHEIRTPLNSVIGFSNLLLSNDITNEVKAEYIDQINHSSEKLLQIIGDIIDLSRLESSQIEITYEETSLNSVVNEIIEDARQVIKRNEKSVILNIKNQLNENGDLIFTDRIWLKRVLSHLMDNALKFTLDGSIEFSYFRKENNLFFTIKDTGIGINEENLGRIFEEFKQEIDGHHRPFEGLGIGLTLAKEVVERMGGEILVKSEKGIGSEFSFSIPYRPAGNIKTKTLSSIGNDSILPINWSSKKCLIVDDNKDVLIYLNRILSDTGISIVSARSGIETIKIIKETPDIDIVLLDMQMPVMNGIEAAKEIRKIHRNLPIIAQTAFVFEDDKDIVLEAGCDACLIKPIRKDHLLTVMSSFLR
jgi:two-component system, chemotaxis family, CheB/CheR fusion protein